MKTIKVLLACWLPLGVYAQEETQLFKVNELGIKEMQPSQIALEYEFKTEIYKVNELGIRNMLPEAVIEKKNEQDIQPIYYLEPKDAKLQ